MVAPGALSQECLNWSPRFASPSLFAADCPDSRDIAATFLDRGDFRASPTAELREGFLFLVLGAGVFLRGVVAGAERPALLRFGDSPATGAICMDRFVRWAMGSADALGASAFGIRASARATHLTGS